MSHGSGRRVDLSGAPRGGDDGGSYGDDNEDYSFNERVVGLLDGIGEFCIEMTEKKLYF